MPAQVLSLEDDTLSEEALTAVVEALREGRLVALPTETGYGLTTIDEDGRARLERVVGGELPVDHTSRPIATDDLAEVDVQWVPPARRLAETFWPGPLSLILPARGDEGWLAHRSPVDTVTRTILQRMDVPLLLLEVEEEDGHALAQRYADDLAFVVGTRSPAAQAMTVLRLGRGPLQVLRTGSITEADVRRVAGRRVLFVCTGNTCRSPMAAALLRRTLAERLRCTIEELAEMGYEITSAGIAALPGALASDGAVEALGELGLSLADHRSQPVTAELLASMDHVYALGSRHRRLLLEHWPAGTERITLLRGDGGDVADPFGGPIESYRKARDEIETEVRRLARTL